MRDGHGLAVPPTVDRVLADAVDGGVVPGAVAVLADRNGLVYEGAFGLRVAGEPDEAMQSDAIFRIASQTKLVTSVAALRLVEHGLIGLDTPVGDVLPEFDDLQVLEGFVDDRPRLRPPRARATLLQLLTHTSGLAYDIWNQDIDRFHAVSGVPRLQTGVREAFAVPLVSDPGERFNYGTSMDWVGLIVEALDGRPLEVYWQEEIFGPLQMTDTVVHLDAHRRGRVVPVHARDAAGQWVPTEIDFAQNPKVYAGGHCLYSTAADYLKLQRAMLHEGQLGDVRLLAPETVRSMFGNHLGDLDVGTIHSADPAQSADVDLSGKKWGLGVMLEEKPNPGGRAAGSGGWMGGFNSFYWVDHPSGVTAALYTQTVPFYDADVVAMAADFERAVYATTTRER